MSHCWPILRSWFVTSRCLAVALLAIIVTAAPGVAQEKAESAPGWYLVSLPDAWRNLPKGDLAPIDGFSWYRGLVRVPLEWEGAKLTLYVEALDDARSTQFNGHRVGATGTFPPQYRSGLGESGRYEIAPAVVRAGEWNAVSLRVYQYDPRPNFSVAPPVLVNESAKQAIRMDGTWQYRPGDDKAWADFTVTDFSVDPANSLGAAGAKHGAFDVVDQVDDVERYVTRRKGDHNPLAPHDAEKQFKVPDDVDFQLVLSEPDITQPLCMTWDQRGRLWVMEYRQYPEVAGVRMVSRDVYLRSVYDKVPAAPPNHVRGRDRISIHEDTDGDGVLDQHKVFVDGLNIATSCAIGRGGVWVTNPPYLLFYPDRDGDDVPDGDPEVHLEGFGLEDSHSVINSMRFGPDGWLYGAQGSTVSAEVRRPGSKAEPVRTMGQQIWRYHPTLRRFEVFAEGGGNTFGVEIDATGRIYSGHNGGDTRGFHYVQGGYYRKGFGKHGPLSNPYAFGYFEHIRHHSVPRFTHNFIIYEENVLPADYRNRLFGVEPLQGQVVMSDFQPFQSSFQTEDISRPVETDDQWFRPVDIKAGPDGAIYVADMYEQRIDHSSHYAGRIDRTNGRIYRLKPREPLPAVPFDYAALSGTELIAKLDSPHKWHRQTILRILGDRRDTALVPILIDHITQAGGQYALELLWALHLSGGLSDDIAISILKHDEPFVRAWTVRLLCDHYQVAPAIARSLAELAAAEPYIDVRKQLASSARRLQPEDALPIIRNLLTYDEDAVDLHQPLLIWWALEAQTGANGRDMIIAQILADEDTWQRPLVKSHLIERLMKRYALAGSRQELLAAAQLLRAAPHRDAADALLRGFEEAYKGRSLAGIPDELVAAIADSGGGSTALRVRQGNAQAIQDALAVVTNAKASVADRLQLLQIFGEVRRPEFIPALLSIVEHDKDATLVSVALSALQPFDDFRIGNVVTDQMPRIPAEARSAAETLLASRTVWASQLLAAIDAGRLTPAAISETAVRKMLLHDDPRIAELIAKHFGSVEGATTEQMQTDIEHISTILAGGAGNPKRGKPVYMQLCGKCHTLFTEGGNIGPDLTPFKRDNLERMLVNVINPSLEIREGFENYVLMTTEGRVVNGFLADQDNQVVVLRGIDGQNLVFRRNEIEELQRIKRSVMPEGALKTLSDQEIRDLFAYLRSSQPVNY